MLLVKPDITPPKTDENDPRIGQFINQKCDQPKAVLIGFPSHEGVRRNGGRLGAAQAPGAIRKQLYKLTPDAKNTKTFSGLLEKTNDAGDVAVSGDLEADQERLGITAAEYIDKNAVPVILGGGHGTAFGHFLAYAKAEIKTSILNLDAHADVRPLKSGKAHSGSPFRQALENKSGCCEQYTVAGLQHHSVAKSHIEFIKQHSGKAVFRDETDIETVKELLLQPYNGCMVTFDMDAVDQAFAPGVSAPCTNGLPPNLWLKAAFLAGKNPRVTSFDLSEVNPKYDRDRQTAKLGALTVWHFLRGLSERNND